MDPMGNGPTGLQSLGRWNFGSPDACSTAFTLQAVAVAVSVSLDSKMSVLAQAIVLSLLGVSCEE